MPATRSAARGPRGGGTASWVQKHKLGAAAISVATVLIALGAWLFPKNASAPPAIILVPDVVGVQFAQAEALLRNEGLVALRKSGRATEDPGTVLEQTPAAGMEAQKGQKVALVVAIKKPTLHVPDVTGLDVVAGERMLRDADLLPVITGRTERADVDPDTILEQDPPGGAEAARGGKVLLILSKKPPASARLVLVNVAVVKHGSQTADVDITVRNDGGQTAVITGVDLVITRHNEYTQSGPLPSSATYDVGLPAPETAALPVVVRVNVSQTVDPLGPGAVDRFALRISPNGSSAIGHIYAFRVVVKEGHSAHSWGHTFTVSLMGSLRMAAPPPTNSVPTTSVAPPPPTIVAP
jgi:hypothetical protein